MERREWVAREDREIEFRIRASSRDRAWSGFETVLYDASAGYSEEVIPNNCISMHVGAPVFVKSACDGASSYRLQRQGDLKIVPAGHTRVWVLEAPAQKLVMNLWPSLLYEAADAMGLRGDRVTLAPMLFVNDSRIEHIAWALKAEVESDMPLGRLFAESLGHSLALQLVRLYASHADVRVAGGLPKRRLRSVIDYVRENLSRDLSLGELAVVANTSPSHFKVLFKQSMGVPVHQFVIQERVAYAIGLLTGGTRPLSDVALEAGFANQSHMASCVRRQTGTSPAALRRESQR